MYTSGRTVKSRVKQQSPIAAATATARRLAKRHLPHYAPAIISSKKIAGTDGIVRMKTEILFRDLDRSITKPLADAIAELPGYHSMCWNAAAISYLTEI